MAQSVAEKVKLIVEPYAKQISVEIWDVVYKKEGSDWIVRIFIDKDGGVSVVDCVDLTHLFTNRLMTQIQYRSLIRWRSPRRG